MDHPSHKSGPWKMTVDKVNIFLFQNFHGIFAIGRSPLFSTTMATHVG